MAARAKRDRLTYTRLKPGENYPGKSGSTGLDVPAIDTVMVEEATRVLRQAEAGKRHFSQTVEEFDAKLLALSDIAVEVLKRIITSSPPELETVTETEVARIQHQKVVSDAIGKLNTLTSRRLPSGNYQPCVVVEGQRWSIPVKDEEWAVFEGQLMLKTSVERVLKERGSAGGSCIMTRTGECEYVEQSNYTKEGETVVVIQKKHPVVREAEGIMGSHSLDFRPAESDGTA